MELQGTIKILFPIMKFAIFASATLGKHLKSI